MRRVGYRLLSARAAWLGGLVVADKGYHSNQELVDLEAVGVRSYISEPERGRRNWKDHPEARDAVYRNRRRIRGARGKRLLRHVGMTAEPYSRIGRFVRRPCLSKPL
jgi:hypothetical protein